MHMRDSTSLPKEATSLWHTLLCEALTVKAKQAVTLRLSVPEGSWCCLCLVGWAIWLQPLTFRGCAWFAAALGNTGHSNENLVLANVVTLVPMLLDAVKHYSDRGLSCSVLQVTSIFRHDTSNIGMGFLRLCCWETLFLVVNPQTASQTCTGEDNWWSEADAWLQGSWCCMRKLQVNRPES